MINHDPAILQKTRLNFVDLMRGMVMLIMIQVHVVNSMMEPVLRTATWFHLVNFINGLVAPTFIFISGFAFMLASGSKLEKFRTYGYDFWKQLGRIALIWFLGYLMHIPYFSLRKVISYTSYDKWLHFYGIDVLQCIGFGLLVIFLLRLWIKSDKIFLITVAILGLLAVLPAPFIYRIDPSSSLPVPLAVYINPIHHSSFPVIPWFGFMAVGIISAWFFTKARKAGQDGLFMKRLLQSGILFTVAGIIIMLLLTDIFPLIKDVRPHIFFFIGRLGCVFMILAGCYYYCSKRKELSAIILYPSRESLAVYFLHLQILYRQVWNDRSLIQIFNRNLDYGTCLLIAGTIIAVLLPVAWIWNYMKTKYEYFGRIAVWTMLAGGGIIFIIR